MTEERLLHMLARDRNDPDWGLFATEREVRAEPLLQCLVYPLAALVADREFESLLCGEEIPVRWAKAALFALGRIQGAAGAFGDGDGRVFTPLLAYHGALAYRKLHPFLTAEESESALRILRRAAAYTRRRAPRERDFLRLAESALALYELFRLTGERALETLSREAIVRLCRFQGSEGNLNGPGIPFDVKRHAILAELLARLHFLDKSAATRSVLKGLLHLLRRLQRPDGSLENEIFGGEDVYAPPGFLLHVRRELADAGELADGLLRATARAGWRALPFLDRATFAVSLTRLIATIGLLPAAADPAPPPPAPIPAGASYLSALSLLVFDAPCYRAFVHPAAGRVKVFSRLHDGALVHADSGFLAEHGRDVFAPAPVAGQTAAVGGDRIDFPVRLLGPRRRLPFARAAELRGERTILFREDGLTFSTRFDPGELSGADWRVFRIYRRLNRRFSPDDLAVATREDVAATPCLDGRRFAVRETLNLVDGGFVRAADDTPRPE